MTIPKKMPKVGLVMTSFPYFIETGESVARAEKMMDDHNIRHLPVQEKGKVVGIVSERDLHHFVKRDAAPDEKTRLRARDVMVEDPYLVPFHAPLNEVVQVMADRHIGSAVVLRRGKLAGVLTVVDVCRVLADYLNSLYPGGKGGEAA